MFKNNNENHVVNERITYVDQLRILSIIWLILINVAFTFRFQNSATLEEYVLFTSFAFGVPVFLMLLGLLMLERDYTDIKNFLKTDFIRILIPFLIWNTVMAIIATINNNGFILTTATLYQFYLNFMKQHWYAWMLLGIYLSLPILSEFIRSWKLKGAAYYLILGVIASIIYQALAYYNTPSYFNLTFFIGPLIYVFAGYYFENKEIKLSHNKIVTIGFIIFLLTSIIIIYNAVVINHYTFTILLHHYNFFTHSYLDVSLIVVLQAIGLFLVFKYINMNVTGLLIPIKHVLENRWIMKFTTSISRSCYGIYLTHQSLIIILTTLLSPYSINEAYGTIILTIIILLTSWFIILLLKKVGVPTKYIGYD